MFRISFFAVQVKNECIDWGTIKGCMIIPDWFAVFPRTFLVVSLITRNLKGRDSLVFIFLLFSENSGRLAFVLNASVYPKLSRLDSIGEWHSSRTFDKKCWIIKVWVSFLFWILYPCCKSLVNSCFFFPPTYIFPTLITRDPTLGMRQK